MTKLGEWLQKCHIRDMSAIRLIPDQPAEDANEAALFRHWEDSFAEAAPCPVSI